VLAQLGQGLDLGDGDQVAATEPADLSLDAALLMGTLDTGLAEERLETVFSELFQADLKTFVPRILTFSCVRPVGMLALPTVLRSAAGDAELDNAGVGGPFVELGDLVVGSGETDLQAFDFTEPAFSFCLSDPRVEVVADLDEPVSLGGVGPEHGAAHAGVFVDARGTERAGAGAGRDLASLEVAEELLPFLIGGGAVFLAGSQ